MPIRRALLTRFWKPVLAAWLRKPRAFHYSGLQLVVMPGVFHPGFFYSSRILAGFIVQLPLRGKRLLDLGCGSGIVALTAASGGASVTAVDIHPGAVECTRQNAKRNHLEVELHVSDLFREIPSLTFDIIAVNPPYYSKAARTMEERAWNAGAGLEYFRSFFSQVKGASHASTEVYMILSDNCDMQTISSLATASGFAIEEVSVHRRMGEKLTLYRITAG